MFRNIYHLGQRQIGSPEDIFSVNLPSNDGRNYAVIPFTLKEQANVVTVNLFHDWAEDLVKIYIIPSDEDAKDLFDIIRDQKQLGDHSNIPDVETILQSKTLEYYEGIEKQFLAKGDYKLIIMNMDPSTDRDSKVCMSFTMSIYVEEQLKKRESKKKTGMVISSYDQVDDTLDEAVIESMTLCQSTFLFNDMYRNPLKVNGGVLSIDSVYRFDNDERGKRIVLDVDTNSVIYVKVTDIYNQVTELEVGLNVITKNKYDPMNDIGKIVTSKRAEKESKNFAEKFVEIQQFVKQGIYLIDLSKSVFEVDTSLFPCTRIRVEIEVRPLSDVPDILKDPETCNDEVAKASRITTVADPSKYNTFNRVDAYYPITDNILKRFKFTVSGSNDLSRNSNSVISINEPTFLTVLVNFEKEMSGGSLTISISQVPKVKANKIDEDDAKQSKDNFGLPLYYSTDSYDGTSFAHQRLDPYLSGKVKLDSPGEYIVTIRGKHKASLSKTLETNKFLPKCHKVSMYYQLVKISDVKNTLDEEFLADAGFSDASNKNCRDVEIDDIADVQEAIEKMKVSNYMDISAKILIPDPNSKKKVNFMFRSGNKPELSVVKVTAALPEDIRQISNMKFHLRAIEVKGRSEEELTLQKSLRAHEQDISFFIDDTETRTYVVSVDFEEIDFELLQTHCSFIELRIAREPAFNILATLASFQKTSKYSDIDSLKNNPKTVTIDKEKVTKLSFYQTKSSIENKKSAILGRIKVDVKLDQVQLDVLAEYNYIASQIQLEMISDDNFKDIGVFEVDDEHYNSSQIYTARNAIRTIGTSEVFKRGTYTLIIKTDPYTSMLFKGLKQNDIKLMDEIIVPITIKIESSPVRSDFTPTESELRLIDIEYNGDPDDDGQSINPEQDLSIILEFNNNIDDIDLRITEENGTFAKLVLDSEFHKKAKKSDVKVELYPIEMDKTAVLAESMVQLVFDGKALQKNAKYTLVLDKRIGINQDLKDNGLLIIKTMSTDCNPKGVNSKKLNEDGTCSCKYPYMGTTCHQCQDEYQYIPHSQECILPETCLDDTCNGHGKCYINQKTGRAHCMCDPGFTDDEDGTHCTRCVSEEQTFPDCTLKSKASLRSSACFGVSPGLLPNYMKDSSELWKEKVGDVRELMRVYSVKKGITVEKIDLPIMDEATVLKIFFKSSPGLQCKVKITDSKENVIFESNKPYETGSFSSILDPEEDENGEKIHEKGYIIFEYSYNETLVKLDKQEDVIPCWRNEVIISMNPYSEFIENSKCSVVRNSEFSTKLTKQDNKLFDVYEFNLNEPISLDERIVMENQKLKLKFKHDYATFDKKNHGSLMILVHYDGAFISMKAKLSKYDGTTTKFIKYSQIDAYEEEMGTETALTQLANTITYTVPSDFYSVAGSYLEAEFSLTDKFLALFDDEQTSETLCFPVSVMIEYIPPNTGADAAREEGEEGTSKIKFVSPAILKDIPINNYHNITLDITLDQSITEAYPNIDSASALSGTMIAQMCALEHSEGSEFDFFSINTDSLFSKTNTIFPIEYEVSQDYKTIHLQFPVTQAYEDSCYKLVCRKDPSVIQGTYFDVKYTSNIKTSYCFGKEVSGRAMANKNCSKCNPLGTTSCGDNGKCACAHPYTGDKCDQCVSGYDISTSFSDGSHKCIKSENKCSPDYCNFKGSCEMKTVKGKQVPTCTCKDMYTGSTCNRCKDKNMQFPGCHTLKTQQLLSETSQSKAERYQTDRASLISQKCWNAIPPSLNTFEDLKYNGEARISGVYSLSEINNKISLGRYSKANGKHSNCLFGESGSNLRVYIEFLEESYVNRRIPISLLETVGNDTKTVAESSAVNLPAMDLGATLLRGEYLEVDLQNYADTNEVTFRDIHFNMRDVLNNDITLLKNGCLEIYVEISLVPKERIRIDENKCQNDHDNPIKDQIFGNNDVLKLKPGFDYSSVADPSTFAFNSKSYAYKDRDNDFFHQKDIELIEDQVQNLDITLFQTFETSSHLLGILIEAPLDGNHDNFMHGESEPDCGRNECIFGDKTFNGNYISYVFNSNIVNRVRLWFYKIKTLKSSPNCTPYHFSIKSTKNYSNTHPKEKVACVDEVFPTKITARRYLHKELPETYIVNDYFRLDSFTDVSFSNDPNIQSHKSTIILNKPSLVKVIVAKESHIFGYEITIFKTEGSSDSLIYTTWNLRKNSGEIDTSDIRASIILPTGQYNLRIRAIQKGQDFLFNTCDTVKVYVGIIPTEEIQIPTMSGSQNTLPDLSSLLSNKDGVKVSLSPQKPVATKNEGGYVTESEKLMNSTIKYLGNSGSIGMYLEISENLSPAMSMDVSEITASVYPDLEVYLDDKVKFAQTDIPVISTSGGRTFMYIKNLTPDKEYSVELWRQKILKVSDSKDIPSYIVLNAYLYSAERGNPVKNAKLEINGKVVSLPVQPWMPACSETVLTDNVLRDAVYKTLTTGIQYEAILVLNEELKQIKTPGMKLLDMKDNEGSLLISVSPYDSGSENILEEFMITGFAKGSEKLTSRSQEFEGEFYIAQVDVSKQKHDILALRFNYSLNENSKSWRTMKYESQCNMIRLNIQYIPGSKQSERKECSASSYDSSIKSVMPSLLPDSSLAHDEDQIINYEYTTVNAPSPKFKIDPFKPDQNKLKFTIKKTSTFRFELIAYPCISTPIERTLVLRSSTKTHNKIMKEDIANGIPGYGNSVILYVSELLPGNYELEIQYGWLKNFKPSDYKTADELMDFQVEIYSLYQDPQGSSLLHHKDRHIRELETIVRDLSVVSFMDRKMGQYIAQDIAVPTHPVDRGHPLGIPFKIISEHAQVLLIANNEFKYIDSIQILRKDSNSLIKRIHGGTDNSISEILTAGEYILQFNYKSDDEREHKPQIQTITFGISDYDNIKKYKTCNQVLIDKCSNEKLGETVLMLKPNKGVAILDIEAESLELLSIQFHYSMFLTQTPIRLYLDSKQRAIDNEAMKHMVLTAGNHTLTIRGPEISLDETCILMSLVEYEVEVSSTQITTMPGVSLKPGVQSILIDSIEKGTTNLPLPSFNENQNDTVFASTLLLHFDDSNLVMKTPNYVELDLNFDTSKSFDYQPQLYYESSKDKMISYLDIVGKPGAEIEKQIEVIHTKDFKNGQYLAHFVVLNGDQIASKFDKCNAFKKTKKLQSLDKDSSFYYNEFGKEDFGLALTTENVEGNSKFYDPESNVFYIEIVYEISQPAYIDFAVEFDIALQNVDLFIFQDFKDELTLEDQELAGSTLDIPSLLESTVSRHTSIYLMKPGKYSIFVVDKKLPSIFKQMVAFESETPCASLMISHSIQPFSMEPLVVSSIGFLSVWPRRLEVGDPFFVNSKRNLEVTIFPNTIKLESSAKRELSAVKFAVIDMETNKKLYNIDPDKTTITVPTRRVAQKDGSTKFVKEVQIRCLFKAETLQNVIGGGRLLTLADPDKMSDKSLLPYYVIVDGKEKDLETLEIQPNKTSSTQQLKEKLTLKQQRQQLNAAQSALQKCYKSCKFGDCNKQGECVCRAGYTGTNCDQKHKIGKLDKFKQKVLEKAASTKSKKSSSSDYDEDYDYDDDEDMLEQIHFDGVKNTQKQYSSTSSSSQESGTKTYTYGWFDIFLLFLLLLGIALIFYQNLWSGRFCRKKIAKKLKFEEEDDPEDKAIIKEELDLHSPQFDESYDDQLELPRIRKRHDE